MNDYFFSSHIIVLGFLVDARDLTIFVVCSHLFQFVHGSDALWHAPSKLIAAYDEGRNLNQHIKAPDGLVREAIPAHVEVVNGRSQVVNRF